LNIVATGKKLLMSSLANQPTLDSDALRQTASDLLGLPVVKLEVKRGGGNNRMFRANTADGGSYAFKVYGNREDDPRDRMGAEVGGLGFLERYNVSAVPRVIAHDRETGCAIYEWIEGAPVNPPSVIDVDAALRFVAELQALGGVDGTERLPLASAATLSGDAVVKQIESRRARFDVLHPDDDGMADLFSFLDDDFAAVKSSTVVAAQSAYIQADLDFRSELRQKQWVLSPSDFGFHNTLRRKSGRLAFIDFEYFGWDDPAKLVSDFLLHPGMTLSRPFRQRFHKGAMAVYGDADAAFKARLNALYPLYGMCWCLIILNEFLPDFWARRVAAAGALDASVVRSRQLQKARRMLAHVEESIENGPRFD
jgi:hypothetical protein